MSENTTIELTTETTGLSVSENAKNSLNIIAVVGIIIAALGFIIALFFGYQGAKLFASISEMEAQFANNPFMGSSSVGGVFTKMKIAAGLIMIISLVLIATGVWQILFAAGVKQSFRLNNQVSFDKSLKHMRNMFILVAVNSVLILAGVAYYYLSVANMPGRF